MLNHILELLKEHNIFLTGGGGVGKSYMTAEIMHIYSKNNKRVVALGSTGISAVGIGGVSIHSFFKFGICSNYLELNLFDKKQKDKLKELFNIIKNIDLLIIDEISMVSADLMEMIWLRLMQGSFSGRVMVVGDFYQLPPVKKQDSVGLFNFNYAFSSTAWYNLKFINIELVVSKRTSDMQFYSMLSRLRLGIIDSEIYRALSSKITNTIPNDSIILFGRNIEADMLNAKKLAQIQNPLVKIKANEKIYDDNLHKNAYDKWVNNLNALRELEIKKDAKVMFLCNKWGEYYNGEQGKKDGQDIKENIRAEFVQFPLKLAYAITIHKSQGMSIKRLVCNLNHIFANGQLYVALSRAISWDELGIIYTRSKDFYSYLKSVVNIDQSVNEFYAKEKFIREKI